MNELETTIAAPFKHGRKEKLTKMELVFYYVQDKRWMSQDQAKKLIDIAEKRNLLNKDGSEASYRFTGTLADVTIPLGFRPGDEIFSATEAEKDPVEALFDDIVNATGKNKKDLAAELQEINRHFDNLLLPQAAMVLLAKKYRVAYDAYLPALKETV
ncbi:DUF2240 family protein [Methanorbis rubei]|uniref:DUF2240 family protein n=1 Tax=Methanorbis rubei TaxID=3028300 RepID=A0AAE4MH26_9EURY|nr:hypothetical protein [Methanocorpusculaceae archaeon Cs1]